MHPILARKGRLAAYLAAWLPVAAVLTALLSRPGSLSVGEAASLALPLTLVYAFLGLSVWYTCRGLPLLPGRAVRLAATHGAAALLTTAVWVALGAGLSRLLALLPRLETLPTLYAREVPSLFAAGTLLYLVCVGLHYVLLSFEAARDAERREAGLRLLAREAELAALKARIQPHFLFNSLNSISALVGQDPARAREMCVSLSDFLRRSLALGERGSIPVSEEIALARSYLAVEGVRFGNRLAFEQEIDPAGEPCLVPPLLLQPLVENAIVHGIATLVEGGVVRLEARRAGHRLRILVENPFDPDAPPRPRGGLGLALVRKRLVAAYGDDAIFAAKRLPGRHLAVISIPARA